MYVRTYAYVYVWMYLRTYIYVWMYVFVYRLYVCMYTAYVHACMHVCVDGCTCVCVRTYVYIYIKGKGKVLPRTGHEGPEGEQMYSSTLPSTSVLDGVGGQHHAPAALSPGKIRYPLYRKLAGSQGRSGRMQKISSPPEFDPRTVQSVASSCTDWAMPASIYIYFFFFRTRPDWPWGPPSLLYNGYRVFPGG